MDYLGVSVEIVGNGTASKVKCARMELREFDRSGRKMP